LEDLVALALATREALVEVTLLEALVHAQALGPVHEPQAHFEHREVRDALADGERLPQEVEHAHPGDLLGVLEAGEDAPRGPLVGGELGDVLALEPDRAARDLVGGVGEEGVGEGGLARSVGPHEHVDLGLRHREADTAQDLVAFHGHVEVVELEQQVRRHGLRFYYHYRHSGNPAARRCFGVAQPGNGWFSDAKRWRGGAMLRQRRWVSWSHAKMS